MLPLSGDKAARDRDKDRKTETIKRLGCDGPDFLNGMHVTHLLPAGTETLKAGWGAPGS